MKTFVLAFSALAAVVAAQSTDSLAPCSKMCADNMLAADKAQELGCKSGDLQCLCTNQNFFFGLRDCSTEICSEGDARSTVDFGIQICRGVGVAITTGGGNGGSEASSSASGTAAPAASSSTAEDGHQGSGTISTFTTTATSSGTVSETTAAASETSAASDTNTGTMGQTTATSEGSSTLTTMHRTGDASPTASDSSSATEPLFGTGGSMATSSSVAGAAFPQRTAAPIGVVAVAGLALIML